MEEITDMDAIRELLQRRRRQILVHSYIYFRFQEAIISNETFDRWAAELIGMQGLYPDISKEVELYDEFRDFRSVRDAARLPFDVVPRLNSLARSLVDARHPKRRAILDLLKNETDSESGLS